MTSSDARELATALSSNEDRLDVIAAIIARCGGPAPEVAEIVGSFDELSAAAPSADPLAIVRYVFGTLGFTGDMGNYYHPDNSLIHRVLGRRVGNPISLAIVATEVSRRVGGRLRVVGFPGHVLVGDSDSPQRWFDPFLGGAMLDLAGCRSLLARMRPGETFDESMVVPSSAAEVAHRVLNNLDVAFRQAGELSRLVAVLELRLGLSESGAGERRQLAHTLIATGRYARAATVLRDLETMDPANQEEYRAIIQRLDANQN